jgi:glycosyltransferase involved in cell wall biosynthesis
MSPKVSVLTSVYNGENHIEDCIDSVLNQTFTDFEYVILNDGSTDQTRRILEKYTDPRLRIIHQENLGIPKSLNKGVSLCRSDLIAHLDADDYAQSHWLEKQLEFMEQNEDVAFCGSRAKELFNGRLYPTSYPFTEKDHKIRKNLCWLNSVPHSFVIFRKSLFLKAGGYDPDLAIAHDYDLWIRLLGEGKGHNLNENLGVFRIHRTSISTKKERTMIRETFTVQWRAYQKLGGSFWKMARSLCGRAAAWFLPAEMRFYRRAIVRNKKLQKAIEKPTV